MSRIRTPRAAVRTLLCAMLLVSAGALTAGAQEEKKAKKEERPKGESRSSTMAVELGRPVAETPVPMEGGPRGRVQLFNSVMPDAGFDRTLVKGSPFTAESTTEHYQTLADGNRIGRKTTAKLYRDGAGRTRREHVMDERRARAADGEPARLIVISDPVAGVEYAADTSSRTVRRIVIPPGMREARARAMADMTAAPGGSFGVLMPTSAAHRRAAEGDSAPPPPAPKRERLESQSVEGVLCEGVRTTVTIPAGEFDNERPLEITREEWYSPELKMIVLMKHNDPRFGETVFRLTNVVRGEVDRTLFEPPPDFRTIDGRESLFPVPGRPARRPGNER